MKKRILVLGCTGSIGKQTLDIVRNMKDDFEICGLACNHKKEELSSLCKEFSCEGTLFCEAGISGLENLIKNCHADIAVNGIAGAAGLKPSVLVLQNKIDLALANKETVVMAWPLIKKLADESDAKIIPVDSEHSAIFNLINQCGKENIDEIIITASGGPFRNFSDEQLESVSVEQALKHPTWNMGPKITIDSASLANKGLEVIEACRLFDMDTSKIKVVIHPQSLIHSLVRTKDGMLYAQISNPDMRHPILNALTWPKNSSNYLKKFDLFDCEMTFFKPRFESFPLLKYAYDCARKNASYTIAFNASNEIAVKAFLEKKCSFTQISKIVKSTIDKDWSKNPQSIDEVFEIDKNARLIANKFLESK